MKHLYRLRITLLFLIVVSLFTACVSDDNLPINKNKDTDLYFFVKVPKELVATRTMTEEDTYKLDFSSIKLYLFKDGLFLKESIIDTNEGEFNSQEEAYEIRLHDIERDNSLVDFVVLANGEFATPKPKEKKEDFYKRLTFSVNGKWDVETPRLLPLWGEVNSVKLDENVGTKYSNSKLKVNLIRAVARIDLVWNTNKPTENEANSIDLYIFRVSVFRSLNGGYLVPNYNNMNEDNSLVVAPTQLETAMYNCDSGEGTTSLTEAAKSPLSYMIPLDNNSNEFKSQIFIPEQKAVDKDSHITLVIGGTSIHTSKITYYKIDLHLPTENGYVPFDILRNHRYIIDIKGVRGEGYRNQQAALEAPANNIDVDFVIWDESINEGYIIGDKYLGINNGDLFFTEHTAGQNLSIKLQTNYTKEELENLLHFRWTNAGLFDVKIEDSSPLRLNIKTLQDNLTNDLLSTTLNLNIYQHNFKIKVSQNTMEPDYTILCDETRVHGVYQRNISLKESNYIEVKVKSKTDLTGFRYEVFTDKIDGIEFKGVGNFNMYKEGNNYYEKVKIYGNGTAVTTIPKILTIQSNSKAAYNCTVEVKMAYTKKKIIGVSDGSIYGYATNNGKSEVFRESQYAFGLLEESIIKVPQLTDFTAITTTIPTNAEMESLKEKLKDTDILILGFNLTLDNTTNGRNYAKVIGDYIKNKGVVILLSERENTIQHIFQELYSETSLKITSGSSGSAGTRYPFITQPQDPISDGPFGCVHGKHWGEDASTTKTVIGIPEQDVVIYSGSVPQGREKDWTDRGVCILRHIKHNLFFIGDAGFISQSGSSTSTTICPFWTDKKGIPIPKPNYGNAVSTERGDIYNSIFFGNVLAWAIDRAEFHGINSGL